LPRDSSLIDYQKLKSGDKRQFDGYFKYEGRFIWYCCVIVDEKKSVTVFLDEELRNREENDCLDRIENNKEKYSMEKFHEKQHTFGTISIISNTCRSPDEIYNLYKIRGQIETMIDTLKNVMDADRTYMQTRTALQGWMFINLIALKWYYTILNLLKKHELNRKFTPCDFLLYLSELKMVKINNIWQRSEITRKTAEMLEKLNIQCPPAANVS
jgi:transposase